MALRAVRPDDAAVQGNLLLDVLADADVSVHDISSEEQARLVARIVEEERDAGHVVYEPEADAYLATVSYVAAGLELFAQLDELGVSPDAIYLAAAGETYAGLLLAAKALRRQTRLIGVDPGVTWWDVPERIKTTGAQAAEKLGIAPIADEEITIYDGYGAPGYGLVSEASTAALALLARTEGLMLDPVYTSKAMAALLDDVADGSAPGGGPIVFLHTGGSPALFHYREALGLPARLGEQRGDG
jgi:1-aminocyclopropane-1-carboxylate deaminase/D-cysteine desulfhydrase-like pyridoxal-dependent ACC family enzyme